MFIWTHWPACSAPPATPELASHNRTLWHDNHFTAKHWPVDNTFLSRTMPRFGPPIPIKPRTGRGRGAGAGGTGGREGVEGTPSRETRQVLVTLPTPALSTPSTFLRDELEEGAAGRDLWAVVAENSRRLLSRAPRRAARPIGTPDESGVPVVVSRFARPRDAGAATLELRPQDS